MAKYSRVHRHDVSYLSKSVRKELTLKYDVFNLATKTLQLRYDIFILSGIKTLQLIYDMRQLATKTLELEYEINGDVYTELEIIYTNWGGTGKGFPVPELPMPTIDPKHKVTNIIQIPIKAKLVETLENPVPVSGRLKDKYIGKIEAKTNKFYKSLKTGEINSRLVEPQDILFDILGQLKHEQKTVSIKAKLNFKPILEMIQRNLLILEGRVETFEFKHIEEISNERWDIVWNNFSLKEREKILIKLKINSKTINDIKNQDFKDLPDSIKNTLKNMDEDELKKILIIVVTPILLSISINVLFNLSSDQISKIDKNTPLDVTYIPKLLTPPKPDVYTIKKTNTPSIDREPTFQNPSSFVGLVTYFPDTQDMIIILNDKPYNYCRVSRRTFDAFKGAPSPGAYYNRHIKGLLICV